MAGSHFLLLERWSVRSKTNHEGSIMNGIWKKRVVTVAMSSLFISSAFADCTLDTYQQGWTGSITFHCDAKTNLSQSPISFKLSDGVTIESAWGLSGAPTEVSMDKDIAQILVGKKYHPVEDYILPANEKAIISFSPSNSNYTISEFNVGTKPINKGTITFSKAVDSSDILDDTKIFLKPKESNTSNGYQFIWGDVKSGKAQLIDSGEYVISASMNGNIVSALPSEVNIKNNQNFSVHLKYQKYKGIFTFSLNQSRPIGAGNVIVTVKDKTNDSEAQLELPWGNIPTNIGNLASDHVYSFSANNLYANHNNYNFSFDPTEISTLSSKTNYSISVKATATPIVTYPVSLDVSGLPDQEKSTITLKDSKGNIVGSESVGNITKSYQVPAGGYILSGQTISTGGYNYSYNNGQGKEITINPSDQNAVKIIFQKKESSNSVAGWPNYLAMGAVTDANIQNIDQLKGRLVDAIFKYAGDGGNGDPGRIVFPIYTQNTINLAESLSKENSHTVKPIMVVYTAEMSGGTAYKDLDNVTNLTMHFINLMLVSQVLQSAEAEKGDVGSIVLNPDLLGMVQQQKLYNSTTGEIGTLKEIQVQESLSKAYWFITTPHNWTLNLNNGNTLIINETTPVNVLKNAFAGAYKNDGVYSPWDIKTAWEADAISILNQAPHNSDLTIPKFADNFKGWIQATNWAIKDVGANVTFGWQENVWSGNSANWVHNDYSEAQINSKISSPSVQLWSDLGVYNGNYKPDFLVFDKYEMDAIPAASGIGYVWNARDWDNYLTYVKQMSDGLNKAPVMLWQIPGGHLQLQNGVDLRENHASTAPHYFFGDIELDYGLTNIKSYITDIVLPDSAYNCDSSGGCSMTTYLTVDDYGWHESNLEKAKNSNVFSILWGGGNTTSVGTFPQNDGGWLSTKVNAYQNSTIPL